jgi:hypothetical protein
MVGSHTEQGLQAKNETRFAKHPQVRTLGSKYQAKSGVVESEYESIFLIGKQPKLASLRLCAKLIHTSIMQRSILC